MNYLLDTDTCISFLKNRYQIPVKIQHVGIENCYVSEITIAELTYGAYLSTDFSRHVEEVNRIKDLHEVISIHGNLDAFGKEKSRLKRIGKLIPDFDLLIGACALTQNMILVTNNVKHLSRIDSIKIENWRSKTWNPFLL